MKIDPVTNLLLHFVTKWVERKLRKHPEHVPLIEDLDWFVGKIRRIAVSANRKEVSDG